MNLNRIIFLIIFLLFNFGCQKEKYLNDPEKAVAGNFKEIFEAFWKGMSQNYLFWDIDKDKVNWDKAYLEYKPKFADLNINNINDLIKSKTYFNEMVSNLSDGHFSISFNHPILAKDTIFPAKYRNAIRINMQNPVSNEQLYTLNPRLYFLPNKTTKAVDPNSNLTLIQGYLNEKTLYFHFNNFYLQQSYSDNGNIRTMLDSFFETLKSDNIKTLVLDLRNNFGGNVEDLNFFLGKMTDKPIHFGFLKYKQGNNRLDYTPNVNAYVLPTGQQRTTIPIYVLVDARTVSMAEISSMALKILPNTTIVGERTWGAQGLIVSNNMLYNGGSFKVSTFLNVTASAASLRHLNNNSYEGIGFAPDISIRQEKNGRDKQLEHVINIVK